MKKQKRNSLDQKKKNQRGFTLVELLVSSAIMIVAVSGILMSYIRCIELAEIARNSSMAIQGAKSRLEQMKAEPFSSVKTNYDLISFDIAGLNGKGISYVDDTDPEVLEVMVSVTWIEKNGRVFGEDINLSGTLNGGEDLNGNGLLDSSVSLVSHIIER